MERLGLRSLGEVFALSAEAMPEIRDIALTNLRKARTRSRKKNYLSHTFHALVELIAALLLFADRYHARKNGEQLRK
jgi:hypothetical protein